VEVARLAGVTRGAVSQWVTGESRTVMGAPLLNLMRACPSLRKKLLTKDAYLGE
jgi:transcriptional regulator with XRE-family HTH domain